MLKWLGLLLLVVLAYGLGRQDELYSWVRSESYEPERVRWLDPCGRFDKRCS